MYSIILWEKRLKIRLIFKELHKLEIPKLNLIENANVYFKVQLDASIIDIRSWKSYSIQLLYYNPKFQIDRHEENKTNCAEKNKKQD